MNPTNALVITVALLSLQSLAGCAVAAQADGEERTAQQQDALEFASVSYTVSGFLTENLGHGLNGTALNGTVLDGHGVKYASLAGVKRAGLPLTDVALEATEFSGRVAGHHRIKGRSFEGAEFSALLDDGSTLVLRVDAIARNTDAANKDVNLFWLTYDTQEGRKPLCGEDANGAAIAAIPLNGRPDTNLGSPGGGGWVDDESVATFACRGYVAAKCIEYGYKPWREGRVCVDGQGCTKMNFADHHVACMRMLRADYCGNGDSHTVDGVEINQYDAFGIRLDAEDWPIEAEWTAQGARCAQRPRVASLPLPSCWDSLQDPACGDVAHYETGTLLMSELPASAP